MLTFAKSFQMKLDLFVSLLTLLRSPLLKLLKPLKQVLRKLPRRLLLRLLRLLRLRILRPLRRIIVYQLILLINVERELPSVRKDTAAVNMVTVESLMTTVRVAVAANLNLVIANKFKKKMNTQKIKVTEKLYTWKCYFK